MSARETGISDQPATQSSSHSPLPHTSPSLASHRLTSSHLTSSHPATIPHPPKFIRLLPPNDPSPVILPCRQSTSRPTHLHSLHHPHTPNFSRPCWPLTRHPAPTRILTQPHTNPHNPTISLPPSISAPPRPSDILAPAQPRKFRPQTTRQMRTRGGMVGVS
jgi:hypothetical protein